MKKYHIKIKDKVVHRTDDMKKALQVIAKIFRDGHEEVSVKYQNADGDFIYAHFEGLAARVFHHEMDHMMGKTFLDGVSKILLQSARRKQKTLIRKAKKDGRRTPY